MGSLLRISSYNLRDLKDDVAAAARVVRAINPDVLCLQEVPRHLLSERPIRSFAARCGLSWSGGHRGSGGTTLMSSPRVEASNVRHVRLEVPWLQRQRGYALGCFRLPGHQMLSVASVHLSLDAAERGAHAATIVKGLPPDHDLLNLVNRVNLVVAGDMNEGPDGQAWSIFAERLRAISPDSPTFPAGNPSHRIDVIFASQWLPAAHGPLPELDPADLVGATDHVPVWADLELSSAAPAS